VAAALSGSESASAQKLRIVANMPERAIPSIGITTSAKLRLPHAVDLPQPVVG
jgi:hypothetical protein